MLACSDFEFIYFEPLKKFRKARRAHLASCCVAAALMMAASTFQIFPLVLHPVSDKRAMGLFRQIKAIRERGAPVLIRIMRFLVVAVKY